MTHLWEIDHPYYCNEGNYYAPGDTIFEYDSWDDFIAEWDDADPDYNLVFRWDWSPEDDVVSVFWMGQRKGLYQCTRTKVRKEDEPRVMAFLRPRWLHLRTLWQGISFCGDHVYDLSKDQYEKFYKDSALLQALKDRGVDNWEGYSDAVHEIG